MVNMTLVPPLSKMCFGHHILKLLFFLPQKITKDTWFCKVFRWSCLLVIQRIANTIIVRHNFKILGPSSPNQLPVWMQGTKRISAVQINLKLLFIWNGLSKLVLDAIQDCFLMCFLQTIYLHNVFFPTRGWNF